MKNKTRDFLLAQSLSAFGEWTEDPSGCRDWIDPAYCTMPSTRSRQQVHKERFTILQGLNARKDTAKK